MPLHLPGYNYLGPGTTDFSQKPVNEADAVARSHDIAYANARSDSDIRAADRSAIPQFLSTHSVGGVIGAAGLGVKYGVESLTGVLYGNNSMASGSGGKRILDDDEGFNRFAKQVRLNDATQPDNFTPEVEAPHSAASSSEHSSTGSRGMSGGEAPGTDGGVRIGAGHNPAVNYKFTKKFQIYSGAFQFHNLDLQTSNWLGQYAESGESTVKHLTTPLCTLDPNQLALFLSEQEWKNLPPYAFAKSCRICVTPLGYRLPFETNSTTASFANSQMIVQCARAVGLNHKFEGFTSGYGADSTDLTKPTSAINALSLRELLYGQGTGFTNIGCNVGIPRHFNWYYNIFNLGRYGQTGDADATGGTPNLLKAIEILNVNDIRGIPLIDFQYKYKCAPLKLGPTSTCETYFYQTSGSRRTTFKAWKPHNSNADNINVANVIIDGIPTNGGYEDSWDPTYNTIVEKAAFMIVDPTAGKQSDITPPLVHFGCMPIQSNPPLASSATFAPGVIQWEIHTEMEIEVLTDLPYPNNLGPWQVQFDPVIMRALAVAGDTAIQSTTWKAFNRGRHIFNKNRLPYTNPAQQNVITSQNPIQMPSSDVNTSARRKRAVADDDEISDEKILEDGNLHNIGENEKREIISEYRRSVRIANQKRKLAQEQRPRSSFKATSGPLEESAPISAESHTEVPSEIAKRRVGVISTVPRAR